MQGRHAAYQFEVAASRNVAYVFATGETLESHARQLFRRTGYTLAHPHGFDVWFPPP
jgi:hypothetical protein